MSLTPSSGTGLLQTFVMVSSDPMGLSDLRGVSFLFNTAVPSNLAVTFKNACYGVYYPPTNLMYLWNDAYTALLSPGITPGSSVQVSNSQCTLIGSGSSFSISDNNLTLNVALSFSDTFVGQQNVYLEAAGTYGSGWVQVGTWTP